ncbi:MAG: DUF1269 domain-containing protein [Rhodobacteraceae bacterium]|nr:DUF1269 domain-containing protein [Paracoccaceae bacterium]
MSDLIVIGFADPKTAFDLRARLMELQKEYLIDMEDAVVVTREPGDKVKLHQAMNLTAAGAASGSFWGLLIGFLFLNPLLGVAVGAGSGALAGALSDIGVNDKFMKELGQTLPEGGAAVFVLTRKVTGDKVLEKLEDFRGKGKVLQTSLGHDSEEALRAFIEAKPELKQEIASAAAAS